MAKALARLKFYPGLQMMLGPIYNITNVYFISLFEDSTQVLAIYGLSLITQNLIFNSVQISFNHGVSMLIAQAFGQGDRKLCGIYLNRQIILNLLTMIPLIILVFLIEPVLIAIG